MASTFSFSFWFVLFWKLINLWTWHLFGHLYGHNRSLYLHCTPDDSKSPSTGAVTTACAIIYRTPTLCQLYITYDYSTVTPMTTVTTVDEYPPLRCAAFYMTTLYVSLRDLGLQWWLCGYTDEVLRCTLWPHLILANLYALPPFTCDQKALSWFCFEGHDISALKLRRNLAIWIESYNVRRLVPC